MQVCATTNHFFIRCKYVPPQIISLSDASMCHHKSFLYQMQVCANTNHFFIRCKYVPPHYQMQVPLLIGLHPFPPLSLTVFPFPLLFYNRLFFSPFLDLLPQDVATQFPQVLASYCYYCYSSICCNSFKIVQSWLIVVRVCDSNSECHGLKVLNHASRTLPHFPYSNLKKSCTEKNWLLSMRSRDCLQGT